MFTHEDFLENHRFFRSEYNRLGKMIRYQRSKLGLFQKDLADLVGLDASRISMIECGCTGYTLATFLLILRGLDLKIKFYEPNS